MKPNFLLSVLAAATFACTGGAGQDGLDGPAGPAGPAGPQGPEGPEGSGSPVNEITGLVSNAAGPVADAPVFAVAIDDTGAPIGTLGGSFTDTDGTFTLELNVGVVPSARAMVFADVRDELLAASLSTADNLQVDPISTAVLATALLITETPRGRTLDDYTAAEMADLYVQAVAVVAAAGTPLDDFEAVLIEVVTSLGGLAADYSEGQFAPAGGLALIEPADASEIAPGQFETELRDGQGFIYDVDDQGEIDNGEGIQSNAFDDAFTLRVGGLEYPVSSRRLEDGDEVVVGPEQLSGLTVTRKVRVDPQGLLLRYTEILQNPTAAPITVPVQIENNLGANADARLLGSSSGDLTVDAGDVWLYCDDNDTSGFEPITAFWFGQTQTAAFTSVGTDNVVYNWGPQAVPPGGRVTLIHLAFVTADPPDQPFIEGVLNSLPPRDAHAYVGMTQTDFDANATFSLGAAVNGEAGAVGPFSIVEVTNTATGTTSQAFANSDGSFGLAVGGNSGDEVTVIASDGTNETVTLP